MGGSIHQTVSRALAVCALGFPAAALAAPAPSGAPVPAERAKTSIALRYPGARIEITGFHWNGQSPSEDAEWIASPRLVQETRPGEMIFEVLDARLSVVHRFTLEYSAWIKTLVAIRRVRPRERLERAQFQAREVDVARGTARDLRGLALPADQPLDGLEAMNTILEGNFPLLSGIRKTHAIQRGEPVRIHVLAGGITLQAAGTAEEPAYVGDTIRVLASRTKRELVGKLREDRIVEVER